MICLNKTLCKPRWASQRDPACETDGDKLAQVARLLGFDLFDWQRFVADVGLEKNSIFFLIFYLQSILIRMLSCCYKFI